MLQLSNNFLNRPVLSLRTSGQIGTTTAAIINPSNLKIEGFWVDAGRKHLVLLYQDIREVLPQGLVINDHDSLTEAHELVRLKNLLRLNFQLLDKRVVTADKHKVGKVTDYAVEKETFFIQKLYVAEPFLKSFSGGNIGVDRSQIVEITNDKIIIQDLNAKVPAAAGALA